MSTFHVIDGTVAQDVITSAPSEILKIVRDTYLQHSRGATVNPDSYFLRFPDNPGARIIALPAHLGGEAPVSGLKWIASYPENVRQNLPRASAVLLLNDAETGYPFACLEASRISAARTAASAALAVETLAPDEAPRTVLFVGAGIIGRTVSDFLAARGLNVRECLVHDHVEAYAEKFAAYASDTHGWQARAVSEIDDALATADLVVLATTAPAPWLADGQTLLPDQLILNLSLRDIHPTVMVKCHNIVDDIDHCLKAQTSPTSPRRSTAPATSSTAPSPTSCAAGSPSTATAPPSSRRSASASWTWRSAATSTAPPWTPAAPPKCATSSPS